jgi:hypothetical protein
MGEHGREAHQRRAQHEGDLVQRALEGERGVHALVRSRAARQGDHAGAGQRPDERHARTGEGAQQGEGQRGEPGDRAGHQGGDRQRVDQREGEDDGALTVSVGESAHERAAGDLSDGERTADQARGGQGAARPGDEEDAAELDRGGGQPRQEGHGRERGAGQGDHPAVRLQSAVRVRRTVRVVPARRAEPPRVPVPHRSKLATRACSYVCVDDTKDGRAGT